MSNVSTRSGSAASDANRRSGRRRAKSAQGQGSAMSSTKEKGGGGGVGGSDDFRGCVKLTAGDMLYTEVVSLHRTQKTTVWGDKLVFGQDSKIKLYHINNQS